MTNSTLQDRIHALGHSGDAPSLDLNALIAAGDQRHATRQTHRALAAGATVAVAASIWAVTTIGTPARTAPAPDPVAAAGTTVPSVVSMAPACPPSGPQLVTGPESDAPVLTQTITASAGDHLQLFGRLPAHNRPDAPVTSVTYIIGTRQFFAPPEGDTDPTDPVAARTLSSVQVKPTSRLVSATLAIPASAPPGTYIVVVSYTFPSPSLCGRPNDPHAPALGRAWSRQGTLIVRPNTGRP